MDLSTDQPECLYMYHPPDWPWGPRRSAPLVLKPLYTVATRGLGRGGYGDWGHLVTGESSGRSSRCREGDEWGPTRAPTGHTPTPALRPFWGWLSEVFRVGGPNIPGLPTLPQRPHSNLPAPPIGAALIDVSSLIRRCVVSWRRSITWPARTNQLLVHQNGFGEARGKWEEALRGVTVEGGPG